MKKITLGLLFSIVTLFSANAQTIYVNYAASGLNDGTSWTDAYTDLQSAIGATSSGEIWVAQGTYYPGGTTSSTFNMKNGVGIYGGFVGTEVALSQRNV